MGRKRTTFLRFRQGIAAHVNLQRALLAVKCARGDKRLVASGAAHLCAASRRCLCGAGACVFEVSTRRRLPGDAAPEWMTSTVASAGRELEALGFELISPIELIDAEVTDQTRASPFQLYQPQKRIWAYLSVHGAMREPPAPGVVCPRSRGQDHARAPAERLARARVGGLLQAARELCATP